MYRRTVTIADDNHRKIQKVRAKHMISTGEDYSYCECLNDFLRKGLMNQEG